MRSASCCLEHDRDGHARAGAALRLKNGSCEDDEPSQVSNRTAYGRFVAHFAMKIGNRK